MPPDPIYVKCPDLGLRLRGLLWRRCLICQNLLTPTTWLLFLIHSWVLTGIALLPVSLFFWRLLCCRVCPLAVAKMVLWFHVLGNNASISLRRSAPHTLFFLSLYSSALLLIGFLRCSRPAAEWPSTLLLSIGQAPHWSHGQRLQHITAMVPPDPALLPWVW